ncbi:MAG: class I adenylate-forming enzyme family protein [Desulfohalobiaceae bacterium]
MLQTQKTPLASQLQDLLAGPAEPDRPFILAGPSYLEVYAIAAKLQQQDFFQDTAESICICSQDRTVLAAAILAALTRPVTLLLPHSFSPSVLAGMHELQPFSRAIVQQGTKLPPGVQPILAQKQESSSPGLDQAPLRSLDSELVKLFTGGSSQAPRIWSKTIRNLFSEASYQAASLGISPRDRVVSTAPANHIYGLLFSVLVPFVASASVVAGTPTYPHEIQDLIRQHQASLLVSTPLHYRMLANIDFNAQPLAWALCSAARLDPADSKAFYHQTGLGITEIFGSTETGGIASRTCRDIQPGFRPFDCIQWKIVEDLLAIRSDFLSPELPVDCAGYFITQDRINAVSPEEFELLGRADHIVKVGGKRVDLDEIRSILTSLPQVQDAAVLCIPDQSGRSNEIQALVAANTTSQAIRRHLQHRLQSSAVPRKIKVVDKIPVSEAGKYQRNAIQEMLQTDSDS